MAIGAWIIRWRYPLIALVSALLAIDDGQGDFVTFDVKLFAQAGEQMFSSGWADTFSDASVQEGPPLILIYAICGWIAEAAGLDLKLVLSVVVQVTFTVGIMLTVRALYSVMDRRSGSVEAYIGCFAAAGFLAWSTFGSGHFAEGFIPLMWVAAAIESHRGRPLRAGIWLGLAASLKIWGILGIPVLLLSRDVRAVLKGGAVSVGLLQASWAPFFIFGTVNTFKYEWTVQVTSFARLTYEIGDPVTWGMRLHQGAVSVATGVLCYLIAGRRWIALWLVPFGIVAMRLVLDPTIYFYYTLPLSILGLLGAAGMAARMHPWLRLPSIGPIYMAMHPFYVFEEKMLALSGLVAMIVLLVLSRWTAEATPASAPSEPSPRSQPIPTSTR